MDENTIGIFHIPTILERTTCDRHLAQKGEACWELNGKPSICNRRGKRAGFDGNVTPKSMTSTSRSRRSHG